MVLLLLFAFIAGIVTVLSPCILPVLPIVLSGSVGGKLKPYGVVSGFILSFTFFTLFLSSIVQSTGISANALRLFSVVVITSFGLSLLIPQTQIFLEKLFSTFSKFAPKKQHGGFGGGLLVGFSLGLIWTPCVGPILASVISLAITGSVSSAAALITIAYSIGTALPMLAIAIGGNQLLRKVPWLVRNTAKIQKAFGMVMIATGMAILFNFDRTFQVFILETFPQYGSGLTSFENNTIVNDQLEKLSRIDTTEFEALGTDKYPLAPEIIPSGDWFNSEPVTISGSRGRVVLVDFWTYSCINCIRTLPYLRSWHDKYADKGLVILGVHSPEFEFEKSSSNLQTAIDDFALEYPIVQDNQFETWQAYKNRFWPAKYLIDKQGQIRYTHFGEGAYEQTENMIRELLGEKSLPAALEIDDQKSSREKTSETYLGYKRAKAYTVENLPVPDISTKYQFTTLSDDQLGLRGQWTVRDDFITADELGASVSLNFIAQQVHLVLEPSDAAVPQTISVLLNGEPLAKKYWTDDFNVEGKIPIDKARKYDLIDLGSDYGRNVITLTFDEGVSAFAFTFGS